MRKKFIVLLIIIDIMLILYDIYKLDISYKENTSYINDISYDDYNKRVNEIGYLDFLDKKISIVKGSDNKFYLDHDIDGNPSKLGSIFMDYRCNYDTLSNCIIYGHSSKTYDLVFNKLINYLDNSYLNNNKYFGLLYNNDYGKYEIVSVEDKLDKRDGYLYIKTCNQVNNGYIFIVAKRV